MRDVGVREFRDHATKYLSGAKPLAISRHGRVIGFYIPIERDQGEADQAIGRLEEAVARVVASTGMTEDELSTFLDPRRPIPE